MRQAADDRIGFYDFQHFGQIGQKKVIQCGIFYVFVVRRVKEVRPGECRVLSAPLANKKKIV